MLDVDVIIESKVAPLLDAAANRYLLHAVGEGRRPVLRVSEQKGSVLALGRYHFAPTGESPPPVEVTRRTCGGRALPAGEGYRTVSLILPHRSALVSDDPLALAPFQVLNRFARGLLRGYQAMGVRAFYPGRDLVTVNRAVLAALSLECDGRGTTLLEANLATDADFSSLASLLEVADPSGIVTAELWGADATTSLRQEVGRSVDPQEMTALLCRGFASQFEVRFHDSSLSSAEIDAIEADAAEVGSSWLQSRCLEPELDQHRISPAQIGVLEARFSTDEQSRIETIVLAGDFIANSAAIEALQRRLRGCPLEANAVERIVHDVFDGHENFILGIGRLDAVSRLLVSGGLS